MGRPYDRLADGLVVRTTGRALAWIARTLLALVLVAVYLVHKLATRRLYWRKVGGKRWR
jgi:hypothetical protein